jgi:hypothetical protein
MKLEQGFLVCRHSDGPSTCSWLSVWNSTMPGLK